MIGKRLKKGDTIGIVAPASSVDRAKLDSAKTNLEGMGFNIVLGECTQKKWFSFAGTDKERAEEINKFFKDEKIDAIMCMRGGYGCNRIVEYLDFETIKNNPKIFIGYSDITTLHLNINEKTGLITFHGPMAVSNFADSYNENTYEKMLSVLSGDKNRYIENIQGKFKVLKSGSCEGKLVGGNLATLVATLGTEYDIDYSDKILFIEEIGEKSYKVDRFLNQLKKHKVFEKINGIILGDFKNCGKASEEDMSLEEVFDDYFKHLSIPVISEVQSGHSEPMLTLPLGARYKLDTDKEYIELLEEVVW